MSNALSYRWESTWFNLRVNLSKYAIWRKKKHESQFPQHQINSNFGLLPAAKRQSTYSSSRTVKQNCRSKKEKETFAFLFIVSSVLVLFSFFVLFWTFMKIIIISKSCFKISNNLIYFPNCFWKLGFFDFSSKFFKTLYLLKEFQTLLA